IELGIVLEQATFDSPLSLDYYLAVGLRIFAVVEAIGFFGEAALLLLFHLFIYHYINSIFCPAGALFTFINFIVALFLKLSQLCNPFLLMVCIQTKLLKPL